MAIISIATTKGGSGKTTTALCLADHWRRAGLRVACLDTDPAKSLISWLDVMGRPIPCRFVDEDDILDAATEAESGVDVVVIDVAGTLSRGMSYALSVSSGVLIPCKPDLKDIVACGRTKLLVDNAIKQRRRISPSENIPHAVVLTQTNRRATVTATSRDQLGLVQAPVLAADIPTRTAYQQASFGASPLDDPEVRRDIAAVADEFQTHMGW